MNTAKCASCGAELSEASPQGLCAVCLFKLGLSDPNMPAIAAEIPKEEPRPAVSSPAPRRVRRFSWLSLLALFALAVVLVIAAVTISSNRRSPAPMNVLRFEVRPLKDAKDIALSPDGRRLAYTAVKDEGGDSLWMHSFDAFVDQPLAGTEGAAHPFWSPDSLSVGFFSQGKLKRIDLSTSYPQILCDAPGGQGGTWNHDGAILFAGSATGALYRVAATGGIPQPATNVPSSHSAAMMQRSPFFFPDGNHFLFSAIAEGGRTREIFAGSLESKTAKQLEEGERALYTDNTLIYLRDHVLMARRFDPARFEFTGEPWRIRFADHVQRFSVSENGVLAYVNNEPVDTTLLFMDRAGKKLERISDSQNVTHFAIAPDSRALVFSRQGDIWISDLSRGVTSRFTFNMADNMSPVWSPDASRIAFLANRTGANQIFRKALNGDTEELLLNTTTPRMESIDDWSPDGRYIVYTASGENGKSNVWVLPLSGERKPIPIPSAFNTRQGRLSPDGRWLAYVSDESGTDEVYVQSFPGRENRWQVSNHGGTDPKWRRDGRELFYRSMQKTQMAVTVAAGSELQLSIPAILFSAPDGAYDVTPDGQRFLVLSRPETAGALPINIVVNWANER
jgi:Tol biopolymer transport system component